jgi:hypothetical protein
MNRISIISLLGLLGVTKSATPGPYKNALFPKYTVVGSPSTAELNSGNIKADYNMSGTTAAGLYRCIRSDLYAFPT